MFNSYAAGNKVYNGGLPNPTSGTVDPSGYVQRELRNKNKPQQSERRSGNASAMMRLYEKYMQMNQQPISNPEALRKSGLNKTPTGQLVPWQKQHMGF